MEEWRESLHLREWMNSWATRVDAVFSPGATREIPLFGTVAAGEPYRAFPLDDSVNVPTTLWAGRQVFALRVKGSSMVDEGIHDGDHLIVEPRASVENGQTVVAEIDGAVTVKLFHRQADGSVRLQPANPDMLPLVVRAGDVSGIRTIGVVVGVLRKFGFAPKRTAVGSALPSPQSPVPDCEPDRGRRAAPPASLREGSGPRPVAAPQSIDVTVNAIDAQLRRWEEATADAKRDPRVCRHVPRMAELGRDLRALREWCARSTRPGLRRALIEEANRIMRRMQRFAAAAGLPLADPSLH